MAVRGLGSCEMEDGRFRLPRRKQRCANAEVGDAHAAVSPSLPEGWAARRGNTRMALIARRLSVASSWQDRCRGLPEARVGQRNGRRRQLPRVEARSGVIDLMEHRLEGKKPLRTSSFSRK